MSQARPGLPPEAKLVFKGVIFEVWQWEQEMFDGTRQIFEKIWRPTTTEVIATVDGQILVLDQDQPDRKGIITFPGGRAENEEDILTEAKRELLEETGYESQDWELFLKHGKDGKVIHEIHYFIARNAKKVKEPELDAGERISARLISFEDFIQLADEPRTWLSPEFILFLLRIRANSGKKEEFRKLLFGR